MENVNGGRLKVKHSLFNGFIKLPIECSPFISQIVSWKFLLGKTKLDKNLGKGNLYIVYFVTTQFFIYKFSKFQWKIHVMELIKKYV